MRASAAQRGLSVRAPSTTSHPSERRAVSLAELELERATSPVERSGRICQVAHRMRRLVGRKGHGLKGVGQPARGGEGGRAGQDEQPTLFQQSD